MEEKEQLEPEFEPVDWEKVEIGDTVLIKHLDQEAVLSSLPDKNGNVQVEIGLLKTTVKKDELVKSKSGKSAKFKPVIERPKDFYFKGMN